MYEKTLRDKINKIDISKRIDADEIFNYLCRSALEI